MRHHRKASKRLGGEALMILGALGVSFSGIFGGLGISTARADIAMSWGLNSNNQLGAGSGPFNVPSPIYVNNTNLGSGVTGIAAGASHGLAVANGAAWAWGLGTSGQLGNSANSGSNVPVAVTGLTSGVTAVAGGGLDFSLAIVGGNVKAWGFGTSGQLGNGANISSNVPVSVTGLTGVTAVAAGGRFSLAIVNGAVQSWGDGTTGHLGNGTNTSSNVPVSVTTLTSGVTAIAAGAEHSLAIQGGKAWAWGFGTSGQLGTAVVNSSNVPVSVVGLTTGVTAIAVGADHSLAVKDGNVYSWGFNNNGQLGDGTNANFTTAKKVLDLGVDLIDVAAGYQTSYALSSDGSLWVWGANSQGKLGLGDTTNRLSPTQLLAPVGYKFTSINSDASAQFAVATVAVPEPASLALLALGGAALLPRRWRRGTASQATA